MPDEKKESRFPETNFLPPLNMVLTFFGEQVGKPDPQQETEEEQNAADEKKIEKLIEKLSEKEE